MRKKMISKSITALAVLLTFTAAASAQSLGERTGVNAIIGASPSTADFVKEAAISDMFEIESSKLAEAKASAPSKEFAARMIADHTKTSSELKALINNGEVKAELPTALDSSHQSKLDKLKGLNGEDFLKSYNDMQRDAHKDGVSLFERYAKGGDDVKLKDWAAKTLPHLQEHLTMAQNLKP
jgi:putative membrane protein